MKDEESSGLKDSKISNTQIKSDQDTLQPTDNDIFFKPEENSALINCSKDGYNQDYSSKFEKFDEKTEEFVKHLLEEISLKLKEKEEK